MTWSKPWDYKLPVGPNVTMADYMLAYKVRTDLYNAVDNFLTNGKMGSMYLSPMAYIENMVDYAVSLTQNNFSTKYAPPSWNAEHAGIDAAFSCFDMLRKLPSSAIDPEVKTSIYDVWAVSLAEPIVPSSPDPNNTSTGPSSVQTGTIFGGSKQ